MFTPSETVSRARVLARLRVGVRAGSPRSRCVVAERPGVGQRLSLGIGRARAREVDGRAAPARTSGWPTATAIGGWFAGDVADAAELADAERAADVGVAEVDVVERSVGALGEVDDVAVRTVERPSAGSKLKTPVTLPLASKVRRLIQFCA